MKSGYFIPAAIVCVFLLSSCKKEDATLTNYSPEVEAAHAEGFTQTAVEAPSAPDAQGARPNPLRASSAPVQPLAGLGRHTPTEARFVVGEALDVPLIGRAFQGTWSETIQQLKGDSVADQDATELTRAYGEEIRATLGQFDGLKLKEFACGVTLCAGTIISGDKSVYAQWHESMLSLNQPPIFSFIDLEVRSPHSTEHRFAFSSDETAAGLSGQL